MYPPISHASTEKCPVGQTRDGRVLQQQVTPAQMRGVCIQMYGERVQTHLGHPLVAAFLSAKATPADFLKYRGAKFVFPPKSRKITPRVSRETKNQKPQNPQPTAMSSETN